MTHLHVNSGSILLHFLQSSLVWVVLMPLHMVLYTLRNLANMVLTKLELKKKRVSKFEISPIWTPQQNMRSKIVFEKTWRSSMDFIPKFNDNFAGSQPG